MSFREVLQVSGGFHPLRATESNEEQESEGDVGVATKKKVELPKKYKVLLVNDDYTTMEFVVLVLQKFFNKTFEEAKHIMLKVHNEGVGICGVYTFEVAETKCQQVSKFARDNGQPLNCAIESE